MSLGSLISAKHLEAKCRKTAATLTSSFTEVCNRRQPNALANNSASSLKIKI